MSALFRLIISRQMHLFYEKENRPSSHTSLIGEPVLVDIAGCNDYDRTDVLYCLTASYV